MKQLETGSASIIISLSNSAITVRHEQDKAILFQKEKVKKGSWDKIWKAINSIQTVEAKP